MGLPRKLKNLNLFNDGETYIGTVSSLELPKLTRKHEDWRGAGMNGTVGIDMGMEKLEATHTYGGHVSQVVKQFGITEIDGVLLRFAGAYQRDDTGEVDAVEIVMRGRHREIDRGTAKPGDDTEFKVTSDLTYYKESVNGEVLIEIDVVNMIEKVDGKDRLEAQRRAIGM